MTIKCPGGVNFKNPNPTINLYVGIMNPMIKDIDIPITKRV